MSEKSVRAQTRVKSSIQKQNIHGNMVIATGATTLDNPVAQIFKM